jgi:hypothetical protein
MDSKSDKILILFNDCIEMNDEIKDNLIDSGFDVN